MEKRMQEWNKMKQEYHSAQMTEGQVQNMKNAIAKAKTENQKDLKKLRWRRFAAAAAAAAVLLAVLPNASSDIAYAMNGIPILSKWVKIVTLKEYEYDNGKHSANMDTPQLIPHTTEASDEIAQNIQKSAEEINEEIKGITQKLIKEFKEGLAQQEGYQSMQVSSEVIASTDEYVTLKLICYQAAGSGYEENHFYTIDLKTGERLLLKSLFLDGSDYLTIISDNIKKQMQEQMKADDSVSYYLNSEFPEWDFQTITDDTSFYLNENQELVICFNEGEAAPMYMGCPEFTIPNDILKEIRKTRP